MKTGCRRKGEGRETHKSIEIETLKFGQGGHGEWAVDGMLV
jgi:hypothetical protein